MALGEWVLIPGDAFTLRKQSKYRIEIPAAFKTDSLSLLGDFMIGVIPPIQMDLLAAPNAAIDNTGKVQFTVDGVDLRVGGNLMVEPHEKSAAMFLADERALDC